MNLEPGKAIKDGLKALTTRNATLLISLYFAVGILRESMTQTLISSLPGVFDAASASQLVLVLPIPAYIAGLMLVPLIAASAALGVTALRVFASEETDKIKEEFYREHIGKSSANLIAGGLANGVLILLVFFIPIFPGIVASSFTTQLIGGIVAVMGALVGLVLFLAILVKLYFWTAVVSIENKNFIRAFISSWEMTRGEHLRVALILLFMIPFSIIVNGVFSTPQFAGLQVAGRITGILGAAITSTATVAILANAYNQLS